MQQSRLIRHLGSLGSRERDRFRHFARSPYFNQHKKTIELLEIILKYVDKKPEKLEKESVFKKLFPRSVFDEQKLYNHMSYLMKLFHRFLAIEHLEKSQFMEDLLTIEEAYEANKFDLLSNRGQHLQKQLDTHGNRDSHFHFVNYRLNNLQGYSKAVYFDRSQSEELQRMLDHFDYYYLAVKLKDCCHLTANMMLMNTHYEFQFLEVILNYIKNNWNIYKKEPSIELYYTILLSLREDHQPKHYEHLKEMMVSRIDSLSLEEGKDLYQFSYNYCIRQINNGHSKYLMELFQLYKQGLQNELLTNNGILGEWDYKNITTLGCRLKEFEWTEQFIQEYKEKLPASRRENAYLYNLGHFYYNKQMYAETLSTLLHVQFTDVKYYLNTNFLLLRTYYAMEDTEALFSLLESYRIYVIRNRKMTTEQKRGYSNFLRFAKRLVTLKHQAVTFSKKELKEKLQKLGKNIEETENVINSYWLLEECQKETERGSGPPPFE